MLTTATSDLQTAYNDASGRVNPDFTNLNAGELGSQTLTTGFYKWTTAVSAGNDATISGNATDTWIFQIDGSFNIAGGKNIVLTGSALARNIFWAVANAVTLGSGSHLEVVLLGNTAAATLETGTTANGGALVQTLVALQQVTVVAPP